MFSQIAVMCSCMLAPEHIVFYGDFLTEEILEKLVFQIQELLQGKFSPFIQFEKNMEKDFECGLTQIALSEFKRKEVIAEWY